VAEEDGMAEATLSGWHPDIEPVCLGSKFVFEISLREIKVNLLQVLKVGMRGSNGEGIPVVWSLLCAERKTRSRFLRIDCPSLAAKSINAGCIHQNAQLLG